MTENLIAVESFYSFTHIPEPGVLQQKMLLIGKKKYVKGTINIAAEGFNGSVSGKPENVRTVIDELAKISGATTIDIITNHCAEQPFQKFKVKLKNEIIALAVGELDVNNLKGEYVAPKHWDEFISQPDVVVVDVRNSYEIEIGTFDGAIDPKTDNFKQFTSWVADNQEVLSNKTIGMYCTGGIRCEKSTAYLKKLGYKNVYHLKGGILGYLEDTNNQNNKWRGKCFVFDDRGSVTEDLTPAERF